MINRLLDRLHLTRCGLALFLIVGCIASLAAQSQAPLARRLDRLIDQPPFDRAIWGVLLADSSGKVLYQRNADRLMEPASNNKLLGSAAALSLLGPQYRVVTSIYGTGPLENGVLQGDLVIYGRGDPTFSTHCYGTDTLTAGVCDSVWAGVDALADSLIARGIQQV